MNEKPTAAPYCTLLTHSVSSTLTETEVKRFVADADGWLRGSFAAAGTAAAAAASAVTAAGGRSGGFRSQP